MSIRASANIRLQHRTHRFLKLKKQGIVGLGHHQGDPAPAAHAADTDHLDRDIDEPVAATERKL
jgi:hypothetical protein